MSISTINNSAPLPKVVWSDEMEMRFAAVCQNLPLGAFNPIRDIFETLFIEIKADFEARLEYKDREIQALHERINGMESD